MIFFAIYDKDITVTDSLIIAFVSMVLVFLVLTIIYWVVNLMKFLNVKEKSKLRKTASDDYNLEIKDDDMMAAVLVATIDYSTQIKKDVRLVSVKEIT